MITYVLPTRDRPERLRKTLLAIGALGSHEGEVIIVDNASEEFPILPRRLGNGLGVRVLHRGTNEGAAARNAGVRASDPKSDWIVMLDDDSYPLNLDFLGALRAAAGDVAAVSADIFLSPPIQGDVGGCGLEASATTGEAQLRIARADERDGTAPASTFFGPRHAHDEASPRGCVRSVVPACAPKRESGGLPEVSIGCGVAIRREAYLAAGGFDPSFNYYVEEYDLAAKFLLAGYRIAFEGSFQVHHAKDASHRDFNQIVARLVRNNSWIAQRYAPEHERVEMLRETRRRYRQIAEAEDALAGYARGLDELRRTLRAQTRTPMTQELFDRFTGLAAAREALQSAFDASAFRTAHLCDVGKNAHVVVQALGELGVRITGDDEEAEVQVIATMSPGPMLDAMAKRRAMRRPHSPRTIVPWLMPAATLCFGAVVSDVSTASSTSKARVAVRRAG